MDWLETSDLKFIREQTRYTNADRISSNCLGTVVRILVNNRNTYVSCVCFLTEFNCIASVTLDKLQAQIHRPL